MLLKKVIMIDPIGSKTLEIMQGARNYNRRLLKLISPWLKGSLVEVGAGQGTFVKEFLARGLEVSALDINLDYLKLLARNFRKLAIYKLDLQTPVLPKKLKEKFGTVVMLNVLEHIEKDTKALKNIYQMLEPGGCLVLVVPAHQWAYGAMDEALGHFRRYNEGTLKSRLTDAGFSIKKLQHISPVPLFGWWLNSRILRQKIMPQAQVQLFDPFVPLLAAVEDAISLPFGLSLLAVAQRP